VASAVFARLQRREPNAYGKTRAEMLKSFSAILTDLADRVPPDVELLFHFCYGDSNHRHVVEPTDMGDMVDLANRLCADIKRGVHLIHMPVPRNRSDDSYFEPLARLRLNPETELSLGLVHFTDGAAGTRKRLVAAERHAKAFSIATECGFGRRDPKTILELLRIHVEIAG
jgi:methionine synthase II (cobalamin-independent)